ncbi:hypothetical protein IID26_00225 [Patescibacteria group bacterium]|nr:hypothetical protein [Patescibacteria group bacterium]
MVAKRKKGKNSKGGLGLDAVFAGAAAAASAGAYYLYGPKGVRHRKQLRGWMLKASGEVMEKAERLKEIDRKTYEALLKQMEAKYRKVRSIDNKDIAKLKRDLKAQWKHVEREFENGKTSGKRAVVKGRKIIAKGKRKIHRATAPKKTTKRKTVSRKKSVVRKKVTKRRR